MEREGNVEAIANAVNELRRAFQPTAPETLFHYTNTEGLLGILRERSLRCTNVAFLNDRTELAYGQGMIWDAVRDFRVGRGATAAGEAWDAAERVRDPFGKSLDLFVSCFCADGDLLSQWRGYAHSSGFGFSLGVDAPRLRESGTQSMPYSFILIRVVYDENDQRNLIDSYLDQVWPRLDAIASAVTSSEDPDWTSALGLLGVGLSYFPLGFKHPAFREEREWRLVYARRTVSEDDDLPIEFLATPTHLVPYVNMRMPGGLPVTRIVCGPNPDPSLSMESIRRFATSQELELDVMESSTPLRW